MRVSQVCAHWCAVALSTPRIWATFMVDLGARGVQIGHGLGVSAKSPGVVSMIERHLRLAGDALFDLNLWAEKANMESVYTILNLCRNLPSLSLRLPSAFHLQPGQEAPHVRVFNLHTLHITTPPTVRQRNPVSTIFSGVTLPALTDLSITSNMRRSLCAFGEPRFEQEMWPQAVVVAMLTRSACNVSSLHLEGIPFETKAALQLLALLPNAIEVSLHEYMPTSMDSLSESEMCAVDGVISINLFFTTELLRALTAKSVTSVAPLIPRLRFDMDACIAMLRSRWSGPTGPQIFEGGVDRLDSVSLKVLDHLESGEICDVESLLVLKKEGLRVRISDGDLFYSHKYEHRIRLRGGRIS
ncbi:hypothetical protein C8J57DRAFT_1239865 [Mycena rebaudengoi]|nr:hypothetical protein C8J57DRAFT_1239865 [Mycena rebaudengoi]